MGGVNDHLTPGPEMESECRQYDSCQGQCRDFWAFSRGSPVSPNSSRQPSPFSNFLIFYLPSEVAPW